VGVGVIEFGRQIATAPAWIVIPAAAERDEAFDFVLTQRDFAASRRLIVGGHRNRRQLEFRDPELRFADGGQAVTEAGGELERIHFRKRRLEFQIERAPGREAEALVRARVAEVLTVLLVEAVHVFLYMIERVRSVIAEEFDLQIQVILLNFEMILSETAD